jgi:hypothetical protein
MDKVAPERKRDMGMRFCAKEIIGCGDTRQSLALRMAWMSFRMA